MKNLPLSDFNEFFMILDGQTSFREAKFTPTDSDLFKAKYEST
jgi:hypothetical protein